MLEEARAVLEECGASHPDTVGVYINLAGIYDAMERSCHNLFFYNLESFLATKTTAQHLAGA